MNNKLFKIFIYLISVILIMSLCFTTSFTETKDHYKFKLAFVDQFWAGQGCNAQRLAMGINYTSGGKIGFDIFPNAELGGAQEVLEALQLGKIDMTVVSTSKLSSFTKALSLFETPFLFKSELDVMNVIFESADKLTPATEKILEQASKEARLRILSITMSGRRDSCFNRPVRSFDDYKGLKIRLMPNPIHLNAWKFLGLNPTTLPWSELYTALQTKVVDAAEMTALDYISVSMHEVAPYYVVDNHVIYTTVVVMSEEAWDSLSPYLQNIVKEVAVRTAYLESYLSAGLTVGLIQTIRKRVKEFVILDADTQKKMRDQVLPKLLDKYVEEIGIDNLVQLAKKDEVVRQWCIEKGLNVE